MTMRPSSILSNGTSTTIPLPSRAKSLSLARGLLLPRSHFSELLPGSLLLPGPLLLPRSQFTTSTLVSALNLLWMFKSGACSLGPLMRSFRQPRKRVSAAKTPSMALSTRPLTSILYYYYTSMLPLVLADSDLFKYDCYSVSWNWSDMITG